MTVDATEGISHPTCTADSPGTGETSAPGTINLVIQVPVALDPGAAMNAVTTATDPAMTVWPEGTATERFANPRSRWGSRIAQAMYRTVRAGADPRT